MYPVQIYKTQETKDGTWISVLIPQQSKTDEINRLKEQSAYLGGHIFFDDGRLVSEKQSSAIICITRDIGEWWGYTEEEARVSLTQEFCLINDIDPPFSLSRKKQNCVSVTVARQFINFLLEFCLKHGVPLHEKAPKLTDDIDHYIYLTLKYLKCAACGLDGEIHHVDAIGMGRDRKEYDDSKHRKICVCRKCHTEAHKIGFNTFSKKHHVKGIIYEANLGG